MSVNLEQRIFTQMIRNTSEMYRGRCNLASMLHSSDSFTAHNILLKSLFIEYLTYVTDRLSFD